MEVGGILTVIEILGVKQARETDKAEALRLLTCVASAGRHHKELICECYGILINIICHQDSQTQMIELAIIQLRHESRPCLLYSIFVLQT